LDRKIATNQRRAAKSTTILQICRVGGGEARFPALDWMIDSFLIDRQRDLGEDLPDLVSDFRINFRVQVSFLKKNKPIVRRHLDIFENLYQTRTVIKKILRILKVKHSRSPKLSSASTIYKELLSYQQSID
jgi:hypothetical protein